MMQQQEYQCSWCKRNKFNGDESCPLNLEGSNGNSDIFDGMNRVIKSCGCGSFIDTRRSPAPQQPEQCPHWKDSSNLKSDFRDQGIGRFYCSKPMCEYDAAIAAKERERLLDEIELFRCTQDLTKGVLAFEIALGRKLESLREGAK